MEHIDQPFCTNPETGIPPYQSAKCDENQLEVKSRIEAITREKDYWLLRRAHEMHERKASAQGDWWR